MHHCKTVYFTKLNCTRSPQLNPCLNGFFLTVFIVTASFLRIPFTIICACMEASGRNKPLIGIKALAIFWSSRPMAIEVTPKIPISPKSKLNGNNISLICNPEKFYCSIKLGQALCKRIFQDSLTHLAPFDFATSCPKIKFGACAVTGYCSFKYLGVIVDKSLSWNSHTSYVASRVYPKLK